MDLSADTQVTVTLSAGDWSTVLYGLDEQPRKTAHIPYQTIQAALVKAASPEVEIEEAIPIEDPEPNGTKKKPVKT